MLALDCEPALLYMSLCSDRQLRGDEIRSMNVSIGSVSTTHLKPDRPFMIGSWPPVIERHVSEVQWPYAPLSVDWPVLV